MVDESTDKANKKRLLKYCQYFKDTEIQSEFLTNFKIASATADSSTIYSAMVLHLTEKGIDISRLIGIGTDGASVMTGKHNGVIKKFQDQNSEILVFIVQPTVVHWLHLKLLNLSLLSSTTQEPSNKCSKSVVDNCVLKDTGDEVESDNDCDIDDAVNVDQDVLHSIELRYEHKKMTIEKVCKNLQARFGSDTDVLSNFQVLLPCNIKLANCQSGYDVDKIS
ncbi:unnamed protein product [Mytilus coruscus]|uniref:DUF4371 domain-containing protein n=1 Tax=Mytilus coruscus TaxID=42192 RepID=A0A6J8A1L9_MYTCO|nr:unnamed protein product [Mytilus coruscus]